MPSAMPSSLPLCFRSVSLVDRFVWPLRSGCASRALLTCDVDGDGGCELLLAGQDGSLSMFKGATAPLVITGFGAIVAIKYETMRVANEPAAANNAAVEDPSAPVRPTPFRPASPAITMSSPARLERLMIVNAESDLFMLEFDRARLAAEWSRLQAAADEDEPEPGSARSQAQQAQVQSEAAHYASSPLVRSHRRFRVPLNVSAMEWTDVDADGHPELVLGTLDRSVHVYSLTLERDAADELISSSVTASAERSRDDRTRSVPSPVPSFAHGRRPSLNASTLSGLQALAAPMLPGSSLGQASQPGLSRSSSKDGSPVVLARGISGNGGGGGSATPKSSSNSPLITGRKSPLVLAHSSSSTSHSASLTRTGSPNFLQQPTPMSTSILGSINPPQPATPSPHSASPPHPRSPAPASPRVTPRAGQSRTRPLLYRLELKTQVLHTPLAIHALSGISSASANIDELLRRDETSTRDATAAVGFDGTSAIAAAASDAARTIPSNASQLLPMRLVDGTTWHMLPSSHFQRAPRPSSSTIHQRAPPSGAAGSSLPPSHNPSSASLAGLGLAAGNASHHGSFKDITTTMTSTSYTASAAAAYSATMPAGLSRSVGRGSTSALTASALAAMQVSNGGNGGGSASSRRNSIGGAHLPSPSLGAASVGTFFHSPHMLHATGLMQPSSVGNNPTMPSPKFGPGFALTSSPRFGFLTATAAATAAASQSYAAAAAAGAALTSANSSPALASAQAGVTVSSGAAASASPIIPSLSLASLAGPEVVTQLPISARLLLVSLDQGVLLLDLVNAWAMLLSFPRPASRTPPAPATGLRVSASMNSIASGPSPTPPPPPRNATTAAQALGSPPRAPTATGSVPPAPLHRTVSAPGMTQWPEGTGVSSSVGTTSVSSSTSSTPVLRPANPGLVRRQPSGINLLALDEGMANDRDATERATSDGSPSPSKPGLGAGGSASNSSNGIAESLSAAATPHSHSVSVAISRNVSSMSLVGQAQTPSSAAPGVQTPLMSPVGATPQNPLEMARAHVLGDVPVPDADGRTATGALAALDALGRFSMQHIDVQMGDTTSPSSASPPQDAWYEYSFQLPGQFLGLTSVPLSPPVHAEDTAVAEAQEHLLLACSLDGWLYFIPTLAKQLPARPTLQPSACTNETPSLPLTLARARFGSRVQAVHGGLYSLSGSNARRGTGPVSSGESCLFLVTFQNELLVFPRVDDAIGARDWRHEWAWEAKTSGASATTARTTFAQTAQAVDSTLTDDAAVVTETTVYELSAHSHQRTVIDAWSQSDAALLASTGALDDASLPNMLQWTSVAADSNGIRGEGQTGLNSATPSVEAAASHLREFREADSVLMHAYRDNLRRQLANLRAQAEETRRTQLQALGSAENDDDEDEPQHTKTRIGTAEMQLARSNTR